MKLGNWFNRHWGTIYAVIRTLTMLVIIYLGLLSIYWGAFYKREDREHNLKSLLINLDSSINIHGTQVGVGKEFLEMTHTDPFIKQKFKFDIMNSTEMTSQGLHSNVTQYALSLIHHEKYWGVYVIAPNSTELIYNTFQNANVSNIVEFPQLLNLYFNTGRHFTGVKQFYFKNSNYLSQIWTRRTKSLYNELLGGLNQTSQLNLLSNDTILILSTKPTINSVDLSADVPTITIGPSELGLVYALVFTIYQYTFNLKFYKVMELRMPFKRYLLFRIIATHINAIILGLLYSLVTIAFQVSVTRAFGHSGFLVLWFTMALFMSVNGMIQEIGFELAFAKENFTILPPWIVGNIVVSLAITFYPLALSAKFYRFGYAIPMFNTFENLRVIFFNTTKQHMGRCYGIMVAWDVICIVGLVSMLIYVKKRAQRKLLEKE